MPPSDGEEHGRGKRIEIARYSWNIAEQFLQRSAATGIVAKEVVSEPASITRYYITEIPVEATSVTSKGQVTIPKRLRQKLGLRRGSKVAFVLVGDRVEMRVVSTPTPATSTTSGFGLLTSKRRSVPAEFDVAPLLRRRRATRST